MEIQTRTSITSGLGSVIAGIVVVVLLASSGSFIDLIIEILKWSVGIIAVAGAVFFGFSYWNDK